MKIKIKKLLSVVVILLLAVATSNAQKTEIYVSGGNAIKGFDPVAFFKKSAAIKGSDSLNYNWKGANWLFSSKENLEAFKATPEKFAPQYGGYCAYGTANGYKAPTQTDTWTIVDNKLYFNYNLKVKEGWNKNQADLIKKANLNWTEIKDKS